MKPLFSRRRFCVSVPLFPLLVVAAAPGRAQTAPPLPDAEPDAQTLYGTATRMLREGRTFEKAAAQLEKACQKEPKNADYVLALGCAWASRAASLAWAGAFAERLAAEQAALPEWQANWNHAAEWLKQQTENKVSEADRKKYEAELQKYRPKPPPVSAIFLIDDKKPYRLTRPELVARLTELSHQALAAWEKSVALCEKPEEKARARYVQGWGMRLLRLYLDDGSQWRKGLLSSKGQNPPPFRYPFENPPPLALPHLPTDTQIKNVLEEATALAPETALYWQARADAASGDFPPKPDVTEWYRRAAALEPKNANLWYRVFDRETAFDWGKTRSEAPSAALQDLHHAQARDKANAWPLYEEAGMLMQASWWSRMVNLSMEPTAKEQEAAQKLPRTKADDEAAKRALSLVARANGLPKFAPLRYQSSLPAWLAPAWNYTPPSFDDVREVLLGAWQDRFLRLASACHTYTDALISDQNSVTEAVRVLRLVQAMGLRIMGDPWPIKDILDMTDITRWQAMNGRALVDGAINHLVPIAPKTGNADFLASATSEKNEWDARVKRWTALLPEEFNGVSVNPPPVYDWYDRNQKPVPNV